MKKKLKIITFIICLSLLNQNNMVIFAQDTQVNEQKFDTKVDFTKYNSYKQLESSLFAVSSSKNENSYGIFYQNKQRTDFIYNDAISIANGGSIVVTQKINGIETYGLIDIDFFLYDKYENSSVEYSLPIKYKNIEAREINSMKVYIAENFDGTQEYYLDKEQFNVYKNLYGSNGTFNIEYEDCSFLLKINSLNDVPKGFKENTPIKGLDGVYIQETPTQTYFIVDENNNKLIETEFKKVDDKLGPGNTLIVWYPIGMNDLSLMILNKDLDIIVPENGYGEEAEFLEANGQIYIKVKQVIGNNEIHYYDLQGNKLEKLPSNTTPINSTSNNSYSDWAKESINEANNIGIVPKNLQSNYTNKITRQEFCQLAVQTYIIKTGNSIDMDTKSPFIDVNDHYVTTAYNLKIVSGTSKDKFSPNNYITRQEAAVMVNNLAKILNINSNSTSKNKFVDESYFAPWAKDAIYSVSKIKSGDVYVMTGTGNGKFSPWFNYTREQAIATMLRLYNYK